MADLREPAVDTTALRTVAVDLERAGLRRMSARILAAIDDGQDEERWAPVQGMASGIVGIPWGLHERLWGVYAAWGHGSQSAERMAERGGFGLGEIARLSVGYYHGEDMNRRAPRGGFVLLDLYEEARGVR